jgi:glucose/arabinose dehydrogenase
MSFRTLLAAAGLALAATGGASAQTAAASPNAAKPATGAQQQRAQTQQRQQGQPKPAAKPAVLPEASPEQMAASQMAHYGDYTCEFDQKLNVGIHKDRGGYVDVQFKGRTYVMKPVLSSTGALRLEDVGGRTLLIQIANKSMLMDTKIGQRMVDECVHPNMTKTAQATPTS